MNNILLRAITGAIFVVVVIGCLYYSVYSTMICLGLFALFGMLEFYQLFKGSEKVSISIVGTIAGMTLFLAFSFYFVDMISLPLAVVLTIPVLFISLLAELWRKKENPILNLGVQVLGVLYVAVPFTIMVFIRCFPEPIDSVSDMVGWTISSPLLYLPRYNEEHLLIFMFLLIWSNDTFAFLTGKMLGRTKLFERISPNKTWEGTVGGIVMTVAVAVLISFLSNQEYAFWIPAAFLIALSASFGDLLESLFKRSLNIKDSGKIMPGHGGILDRFDAALFAAPIFLCWWLFYIYFCN